MSVAYDARVSDRQYFESVDGALRSWGKLEGRDLDDAKSVVARLAGRLGAVHSVYIGQRGSTVGLSFGSSQLVDVYISPEKLDVAPHVMTSLGGMDILLELHRGFVFAPGQRTRYARYEFTRHRERSRRSASPPADAVLHCGARQPVGSECAYCGDEIVSPSRQQQR